jgi:membrane protease YdiL (CAAX protease family)
VIAGGILLGDLFDESSSTAGLSATAILVGSLITSGLLLAVSWLFGPRAAHGPLSSLGFTQIPASKLVGYGLLTLVGSLSVSVIYLNIAQFIGSDHLLPQPISGEVPLGNARIASYLLVAGLGPLAEETFFRGFLLGGLAPAWGFWPAALVSSAIFSGGHLELGLLVPSFFSGLLFVWVFSKTGSLWPVVLAHAAQNFLALSAPA